MKKNLLALMMAVVCFSFCLGFKYAFDVLLAPDGIQIGEDVGGRLPMKEWDEYPFETGLGEMSANEVRILNFGPVDTFHAGAGCNRAEVLNPEYNNNDKLLVLHTWYDGDVKVMVQNLANSTTDFGNDQMLVTCWNSSNFGSIERLRDGQIRMHRSRLTR